MHWIPGMVSRILLLGLFALSAMAQQKASQLPELPKGSVLRVVLPETLAIENSKVGDPILADVLGLVDGDKIKRPRQTLILVGHITEIQLRTDGQAESRLGIAFDKIQIKSVTGAAKEFSVSAVVKRVVTVEFPVPRSPSSVPTSGDNPVQRAAGPMIDSSTGKPVYSSTPLSAPGPLPRAAKGAYEAPVKDFTLRADESTSVTLILCKKRNIVLGPGTPMIIQVTDSGK